MKKMILVTQSYKDKLEEFLPDLSKGNLKKEGNLYKVDCPKGNLDTEILTCLLEHIVILEHSVYGSSAKLAGMALDLRHTEIHQRNVMELDRYLRENSVLHLEGYVAFRMAEYRNRLDIMMYRIIKKLKLTDSLL